MRNGTHPAPPSPDVGHMVDADRLNLAVIEAAFVSARAARTLFATPAFQAVLAAQPKYLDAIGADFATAFYTFVRDGQPTPAGIRGSRQAELIDQVGAANQLEPHIVRRFVEHGYV